MSVEMTAVHAPVPSVENSEVVHVGDDWLSFERGSFWILGAEQVAVESLVSVDRILVRKIATGEFVEVSRSDLAPTPRAQLKPEEVQRIEEADTEEIREARRMEAELAPYAEGKPLPAQERAAIAEKFDVSLATISRKLAAYRLNRSFTAFLNRRPGVVKGEYQLTEEVEAIITAAIKEAFKNNDDVTVRQIWDRIEQHCKSARLVPPGKSTVQRRIRLFKVDPRNLPAHLRNELERDRQLVKGQLVAGGPLHLFQVDHTILDIPVNCPVTGKSLGCPWITIVFSVSTRAVMGFCLTLESPSQLSTALALHHAVFPKEEWLKRIGATGVWTFFGIPLALHLDNAREFVCDGLRRAAMRWGIQVFFRRPGHPQDGAHIERFLGTLMISIKALRGATNHRRLKKRLKKTRSQFTLQSLETWVANTIIAYHHEFHRGLNMTPAQAWERAWTTPEGIGSPVYPRDERDFLISFLPVVHRVVSREGIEWNGLHYRCDELQPYVEKQRKQPFRYDPRDITKVYFDANGRYIEVPWTQWNFPKMSLWEWKELKPQLRLPPRETDSVTVHQALEANRELIRQQASRSETARRRLAREQHWDGILPEPDSGARAPLLPSVTSLNTKVTFEVLE